MINDDKVFYPEELKDQPLPNNEEMAGALTSQSSSGGVLSTTKFTDTSLPRKVIAHETIASSLNTKSRKILGEYQFTESGAIQVGKYENGVSGDMRLSPNGITARDSAGLTTFAIDGTTGDATFKGTIQAGAFIVGTAIEIEESSEGNGRILLYNDGVPQILIGEPDE